MRKKFSYLFIKTIIEYLKIDVEVGKVILRNLSYFRREETLFSILKKTITDVIKSTQSTENYSGNYMYITAIWIDYTKGK